MVAFVSFLDAGGYNKDELALIVSKTRKHGNIYSKDNLAPHNDYLYNEDKKCFCFHEKALNFYP
jgi:hypothetical protein